MFSFDLFPIPTVGPTFDLLSIFCGLSVRVTQEEAIERGVSCNANERRQMGANASKRKFTQEKR